MKLKHALKPKIKMNNFRIFVILLNIIGILIRVKVESNKGPQVSK